MVDRQEVVLAGGNETQVVRLGSTVLRPAGSSTPAIHRLLEHLVSEGFDGAPQALGIDDHNREILTFIEGEVGHYPMSAPMRSDAALFAAARLLRRFHDASVGMVNDRHLPWRYRHPDPACHEVICHNDVAPYNLVYCDGLPTALIDFDHAGPGPRLWDVAHAAFRLVPLASDTNCRAFGWQQSPNRPQRLVMFCDAYGLDVRDNLLKTVVRRIEALRNHILNRAAAGDLGVQRQLEEDHVGSYASDIASIHAAWSELAGALERR